MCYCSCPIQRGQLNKWLVASVCQSVSMYVAQLNKAWKDLIRILVNGRCDNMRHLGQHVPTLAHTLPFWELSIGGGGALLFP